MESGRLKVERKNIAALIFPLLSTFHPCPPNRRIPLSTAVILMSVSFVNAAFLNFGGGARHAALGRAVVAGECDAFSGQVNVAMLALMKNSQFIFEYQNLYAGLPKPDGSVPGYKSPDISVSNIAAAVPFRRLIGTFGVSYMRFGNSDLYTEETVFRRRRGL